MKVCRLVKPQAVKRVLPCGSLCGFRTCVLNPEVWVYPPSWQCQVPEIPNLAYKEGNWVELRLDFL